MENTRFCQSCGMPMGETNEMYGANADGSKSADYCSYCYKDGEFTANVTIDEMIAICVAPMVQSNPEITEQSATAMMNQFFPQLKRWKK